MEQILKCTGMEKSMKNKVRLGIDVGGTFTDAVVIDNQTYEVIAKAKVPTTHHAKQGVALGIVEAINKVLTENNIDPEDVIFIAHGTTQATNALLEGDVAKVGVLGMGTGFEAGKAKSETTVGNIELAPGKFLYTTHTFLDSSKLTENNMQESINTLIESGAQVVVASEAYSVDNPENEKKVIEAANKNAILATGGYEISQLYGLQARTRTAVVNAALIPKMMETANMTEKSVREANIKKPLMIMRCDGGVMSVDEVRKRPILTMLSGLAAGVAGALMYEKITDGIFLEVGGTSTDISAIKDGKVMIKNAQVGGRKLYLTSLDVRTLGIAGGSMIVMENGKISDVGPRSAHIADMGYEVFANESNMINPKLKLIAPREDDVANYAVVECNGQKSYALTLAGAANILGYVPESDYAHGNALVATKAWAVLADKAGITVEEACQQTMNIAIKKISVIVEDLIKDYDLNKNLIYLVGGGGSASVVTPFLGEKLGIRQKIAKNAPYISTIGVALALVREQIERNVTNPTQEDIRKIRSDIMEIVTKAGANPDTVEIAIEIDSQKSILRAIATGATELRTKDLNSQTKTIDEIIDIVQDSAQVEKNVISYVATIGRWHAFEVKKISKAIFGLIRTKKNLVRIVDEEGVIRLQKNNAKLIIMNKTDLLKKYVEFIDDMTQYTDAGATLPKAYLFFKQKMVDLSGVVSQEQLLSLAQMELEFIGENDKIIAVAAKD